MEKSLNGKYNNKEIESKQEQEEEIQMLKIENEAFEQTTFIISKDKKKIKK